jgi:hypothetical protein
VAGGPTAPTAPLPAVTLTALAAGGGITAGSERRLYNPYYDLPTSPEFLFQEAAVVQRQPVVSWGENLTFPPPMVDLPGSPVAAAGGTRPRPPTRFPLLLLAL